MAYSGSFFPKNVSKYSGDVNKITYRSLWEKKVMEWLDLNPDVLKWDSEETIVPYICKTDGLKHRYFVDFTATFKSGKTVMIEVKPKAQTVRPDNKGNKVRFLNEAMTYTKNISKWEAAREYARKRGWSFQIWTEDTLELLGIRAKWKPLRSKKRISKRKQTKSKLN